MWQFILGGVIWTNISLFLYALILAGKRGETHYGILCTIILATVLFNEKIKANKKLLYAIITVLSNKEGYCYASNNYLGRLLNAKPHTISKWASHLKAL